MRKIISVRIPCGLVVMLALAACGGDKVVGALHDAGADAPTRTGPYDECGNGMDDDGDGQIDEDCFCGGGETQPCFTGMYPNRGVGACADGVQTCDATSTMEFGHWGACTMDTLPADEACDGVDNDCDGAIDEGCPCTAGQTQGCGSEFAIAPCSAGTQTCGTDGTWSACEGAIGPSAEVCGTGAGDGIDNDCDGMTDEGCTCVPQPEVCSDGVDNDCDGTVDEASCTFSMTLPDACVSGPVEICGDLVDNDCDGTVDELECTINTHVDAGMDATTPDAGMDATTPDAGAIDAGVDAGLDATMGMRDGGTDGCTGAEICGDGVDNDCDGTVDEGCATGCSASTVPADVEYVVDSRTDSDFAFVVDGDDTTDTITCGGITTDPGEIDYTMAFRIAESGRYEYAVTGGVAHLAVWYLCDFLGACDGSTTGGDGSASATYTYSASRAGERYAFRVEAHATSTFRLHVRYLGPL